LTKINVAVRIGLLGNYFGKLDFVMNIEKIFKQLPIFLEVEPKKVEAVKIIYTNDKSVSMSEILMFVFIVLMLTK
jgi:hypothetical protein